ncbi:VWA domain-containing protein [Halorhabdus amylolytica]|uniref:VWA domain-containing protein n=1 Tax=Halorhabdus amylolytica TaxID=2559573 RepID=UPI00145B2C40|nr:VWA domain-containing protein [Halorhabdus amylolytica]
MTGTDPLDPDSDAPSTDSNEANNGTIDGHEDFDGDHLLTIRERELGTDPIDADTDDDDLPDGFEDFVIGTDPLDADTDDDGTTDGAEDLDSDDLSNAEEYDAETSPQYADIDADGLTDPQELANDTDPWSADTDNDGLDDGVELTDPFFTDPLDNDTDGDGIEDGNETYTTTTGNESLGVDVELTGQGNVAGGVSIGEETERFSEGERVQNMSVSEIVEIESTREFESANVTIEYDDSLPATSNESDLVVVTYDREKQLYVPINSTIDAENNTVTAETEHFSTFAVFSISNWVADVTAENPSNGLSGDESSQPMDVQFIIDTSYWMGSNDPQELRYQAAKELGGALGDGDRAGVIKTGGSADIVQPLTTDFEEVNRTIGHLEPEESTDISGGIHKAISHFESASSSSRKQVAVLFSQGNGWDYDISPILTARERGITIHTIGVGEPDESELIAIAKNTNGTYHRLENSSDLSGIIFKVVNDGGSQDSDGDGLPDVLEENGLPIGHIGSHLRYLQTDPHSKHTDDDSLTDGEEAAEYREYPIDFVVNGIEHSHVASYFELRSNPKLEDSDDDGLDDYEELRVWDTDPQNDDTDNDNLNDQVDPNPFEENALPEVEYTTARSYLIYQDQFRVRASGTDGAEDIEDITVHKHINPLNPLIGGQWQDATGTVISSSGEWYEVRFDYRDERRFTEARPDRLKIMVTDELGNDVTILHDRENGDGVVKAGLAAGATVAVPSSTVGSFGGPPGWAAVAGVTVGATVVGGAMELSADSVHGHHQSKKFEISVPSTKTVGSWETPTGLEVALTTGTVYATEVSHGREYTRGFGWEYIDEITSLSQADIQHVIETGTVVEYGSNKHVIGDPLSDKDKAILTIIGGVAVAAEEIDRAVEVESEENTCNTDGYTVETENDRGEEGNPEHTIRDEKPINDIDKIDNIIKNPSRILDYPNKRYFIKKFDDGFGVIVTGKHGKHDSLYELITQLNDGGSLYDSMKDAIDDIRDEENGQKPDENIDC